MKKLLLITFTIVFITGCHAQQENNKAIKKDSSVVPPHKKLGTIKKKYNLSERRKILAYSSSLFDPYYIKGYYGKNGIPGNIQKPLLAYVLHYDPAAEKEFKLHNYYRPFGFKELISTIKTGYWMDGPW